MEGEDKVEDVMAANTVADREKAEKKKRKEARLEEMVERAARRALQECRHMENEGKRRAREKATLKSFWGGEYTVGRRGKAGATCISSAVSREQQGVSSGEDALHVLATGALSMVVDSLPECGGVDRGGPTTMLLASTPGVGTASSDSSPQGSADLNWKGGPGYSSEEEELFDVQAMKEGVDACPAQKGGQPLEPAAKRRKSIALKNYDLTRRYQLQWAAKLPWSEGVLAQDGILHQVKCLSCSDVGRQPLLLQPRWHTLEKHDRCEKHKKNQLFFSSKRPTTVLEQVNKCNTIEARRKRVQFATLFQCLREGRSMLEFESRFQLYKFLHVPDLPSVHWSDSSGWIMAEHMYSFVKERVKSLFAAADFIAMTADETSCLDNTSWIAIHGYVMRDWERFPMLITIQKLESDGATADSLTAILTTALEVHAGLTPANIASKLVCFGADGVSAFQGKKKGVSKQLKDKWAPFIHSQHCLAHKLNLAYKTLSEMGIFGASEELLRLAYNYFAHSPKKRNEFHELAQMMETKGLKMLKNVKTRWVSLISPLRRVLSEYRSLMAKMQADSNEAKWGKRAKAVLMQLKDPYVALGMMALIPLLEIVDTLMKWAQQRDVYICDFVAALHKCEGKLFEFYLDKETAYKESDFFAFKQLLLCNHEQITLAFQADMNKPECELAFLVGKEIIFAEHEGERITRSSFAAMGEQIKAECSEAVRGLLEELETRFPAHALMDALGIVYPQYWKSGDQPQTFRRHLDIIKKAYTRTKWVGSDDMKKEVAPILNGDLLESQQPLFKLAMISNSVAACALPPVLTGPGSVMINPLTKIWRVLDGNNALSSNFSEYIKLAQLAMTHVLGSVEDERCFSSLSFLKDKLRNRLDGHLSVVVGMHSQNVYSLQDFPYDDCFKQWANSTDRGRYGLHGVEDSS